MNLGELALKKKVVTGTITLVLLGAGLVSFNNLARLEDPEFTIKEAIITTPYPGASAAEVEEEVSDLIERAAQEMAQLKRIESTSSRGKSEIKAVMHDEYDKHRLPQVWDELRRKVNDYQTKLPPGAGPSIVNDDFGDVYGTYYALSGEGYTPAELKEVAKLYRRELLLVDDVKRVVIWGARQETIFVEMSRSKMAALGISQQNIYDALSAKNLPADAGRVRLGREYIPIKPTGEYKSEKEFAQLLVSAPGSDRLVFLGDVATIRRDYADPPSQLLRFNGQPAVAIGISTVPGGNVVTMGEGLGRKLEQLESQIPKGIELHAISLQSESVIAAIDGFVINLLEAVIIVVVVLLFFMGLRSGLIIGGILFLTISGTFLFMNIQNVILERISLGALIIALGMLVDNAIVVVDGMKVKIEAGVDRLKAASDVVGQQAVPLFGATVVAILAFAAIGTSQDSTGEYCRSLFTVILISLGLSWFTAVTSTPLLAATFLKGKDPKAGKEEVDPYGGFVFRAYRAGLTACLRSRWAFMAVVLGLFAVSIYGFGYVSNMFFPGSTRPQFFIELYLPEGSSIYETEAQVAKVEKHLKELKDTRFDDISYASAAIGGGDLRFLLTYTPIKSSPGNAVIFVDVDDWTAIENIVPVVQRDLEELLPGTTAAVKTFRLGPGEGGRIQVRISGPDREVLRALGREVKDIMLEEGAIAVRDEWKEKVKVVVPQIAEAQARRLGIDRPMVARALQGWYDGTQTGVYREADELLPILARSPASERREMDNLRDLQIWSPAAGQMIPMRQILSGFETRFEDANIWRRDRSTTIRIHCDQPFGMLASDLAAKLKPRIEKALNVDVAAYFGKQYPPGVDPLDTLTAATIPVKDMDQIPLKDMAGYFMAWGGEEEDSARAQAALAGSIPVFVGIMVLTVIFLFNAVRQPLVIWLTVPLAVIGVTAGLLVFNQPFGFMALLGALSLTGMLIKNSIVLIDEIDTQIATGKDRFQAVVESGVSRTSSG